MEDFTDGEDFLMGSPLHTNLFCEDGRNLDGCARKKTILLEDPIMNFTKMANALSLPFALEPQPDSPDCFKRNEKSRDVRSERTTDTDQFRHKSKEHAKKKSHNKKRGHGHGCEESTLHFNVKDFVSSKETDMPHMSSRESGVHKPADVTVWQSHEQGDLAKEERSTKWCHGHDRDLPLGLVISVEKAISERVCSIHDKPKKTSSGRPKEESHLLRCPSLLSSVNTSSVATADAQK